MDRALDFGSGGWGFDSLRARNMNWYVYVVQSSDNSLYCGITNDIEKRVKTHNAGKGSKSLRGKLPVSLVYSELYNSRTDALKRESEIKSLSRSQKLDLISGR